MKRLLVLFAVPAARGGVGGGLVPGGRTLCGRPSPPAAIGRSSTISKIA